MVLLIVLGFYAIGFIVAALFSAKRDFAQSHINLTETGFGMFLYGMFWPVFLFLVVSFWVVSESAYLLGKSAQLLFGRRS